LGVLSVMAAIAKYIPSVPRPKKRPSLGERLLWTLLALLVYLLMAHTPLYGIQVTGPEQFLLIQVIFAAHSGTLMELGIGPIVTAGLIMQILAGAKIIDIDITDPEKRREYSLACRYWHYVGNPVTHCLAGWNIRLAVALQLFLASLIIMILDEMIQKGWGIGSGVSLFILAGVATTVFWSMFSPLKVRGEYVGFIPYAMSTISRSGDIAAILARPGGRDLIGLLATFTIVILLVYLSSMRIEIPITSPRLYTIKARVPLQFLYVSNIPVLFIGILYSNIIVFAALIRRYLSPVIPAQIVDLLVKYDEEGRIIGGLAYYLTGPHGVISASQDPVHTIIYSVLVLVFAVIFGLMWVEVAGLNPSAQAQQLIESGFEVPGLRRNPRILEQMLSKYIYPLTILSSIIVALIAIVADILGAYGTGMGLLLATGILQQYYTLIAYERALEAYPLLRRLIGE
jgi:preprotein translocase subunit SecY